MTTQNETTTKQTSLPLGESVINTLSQRIKNCGENITEEQLKEQITSVTNFYKLMGCVLGDDRRGGYASADYTTENPRETAKLILSDLDKLRDCSEVKTLTAIIEGITGERSDRCMPKL